MSRPFETDRAVPVENYMEIVTVTDGDESQTGFVPDIAEATDSAPAELHRRSLRRWLAGTRLGRMATATFTAAIVTSGVAATEAPPANAGTTIEYSVSDSAAGGVYARYAPHTADTHRIAGDGVYPGDTVRLACGVTDGDPVVPYHNTTWHFVKDLNRPGEGKFWLNDHYVKSPNAASHLAPGEPTCRNESSNPLAQPATAPSNPSTPNYEGQCVQNVGAEIVESWDSALEQWNEDGELKGQLERYDTLWGNPGEDDICVGAQLSNPDPSHGNGEFISSVVAVSPDTKPGGCSAGALIEVWGNGFYRSTD